MFINSPSFCTTRFALGVVGAGTIQNLRDVLQAKGNPLEPGWQKRKVAGMRSTIRLLAVAASITLIAASASAAAPDFNLRNLQGERVNLKTLLAKGPVLLDFWATYCKPCIKAMPKLQKIHEKYGKSGLTVLGVNVDGPRGQNRVKPFLRARKVNFPIALDSDSAVMRRLQVNVLPTTLLITPDGEIVLRQVGYNSKNADVLLAAVEALFPDSGANDEENADASADQ